MGPDVTEKLDTISQQITVLLDELNAAPLNAESKNVIAGIRDVREQYLASRFRILQELQNHNRQAAMQEMMTTTVNVQQAYKAKVQALIAIEDRQMLRAGAQVESDFNTNRALLSAPRSSVLLRAVSWAGISCAPSPGH